MKNSFFHCGFLFLISVLCVSCSSQDDRYLNFDKYHSSTKSEIAQSLTVLSQDHKLGDGASGHMTLISSYWLDNFISVRGIDEFWINSESGFFKLHRKRRCDSTKLQTFYQEYFEESCFVYVLNGVLYESDEVTYYQPKHEGTTTLKNHRQVKENKPDSFSILLSSYFSFDEKSFHNSGQSNLFAYALNAFLSNEFSLSLRRTTLEGLLASDVVTFGNYYSSENGFCILSAASYEESTSSSDGQKSVVSHLTNDLTYRYSYNSSRGFIYSFVNSKKLVGAASDEETNQDEYFQGDFVYADVPLSYPSLSAFTKVEEIGLAH